MLDFDPKQVETLADQCLKHVYWGVKCSLLSMNKS